MAKLSFIAAALAASVVAACAADGDKVEIKGFLASEWCIKNSYLKDCRLESTTFSQPVIYVHSEQKYYYLDLSEGKVKMSDLDEGFARNDVTIGGILEKGNTIKVETYKAPPPEGKSFFKGCM